MPLEGEELPASLGVPHPHRWVRSPRKTARAGQALSVRAEDHGVDLANVPLKAQEFLAGLRIPHFHRGDLRIFVPPTAGQALAVRAEGYIIAIAIEGQEFSA